MTTDLARAIATLPEPQYRLFWTRITRDLDRLCRDYGEDDGITQFQEQIDHEAQEPQP